jgi:hypothetical protein
VPTRLYARCGGGPRAVPPAGVVRRRVGRSPACRPRGNAPDRSPRLRRGRCRGSRKRPPAQAGLSLCHHVYGARAGTPSRHPSPQSSAGQQPPTVVAEGGVCISAWPPSGRQGSDVARAHLARGDPRTAREAHFEALGAAMRAGVTDGPGGIRDAARAACGAPTAPEPQRAVDAMLDAVEADALRLIRPETLLN